MKYLREVTRSEQSQPNKEAMRAKTPGNILGAGLHKPSGIVTSLQLAQIAGLEAARFDVCPAGFCFSLFILVSRTLSLSFEIQVLGLCLCLHVVLLF